MRSSNGGIRRAIDVVQRAGARYPWAGRIQALDAAVRTDQAADEHQHRRITACPFPKATGTYLHCSGLLRLEHKGVALTRCAETDAQRVRGQSGSRRAPACSAGDPSVAGKRPDTLMQQSWPTSSLAPARDARLSTVDAPSLGDEIATVAAAPGIHRRRDFRIPIWEHHRDDHEAGSRSGRPPGASPRRRDWRNHTRMRLSAWGARRAPPREHLSGLPRRQRHYPFVAEGGGGAS